MESKTIAFKAPVGCRPRSMLVLKAKSILQGVAHPLAAILQVGGKPSFGLQPLTALANEAGPDRIALIGLGNEIVSPVGDGWALIPYGNHPNERGLQPFGKAEAEQMVGYFKNTWNTLKRAFVGMPILRGHPDMVGSVRKELARAKDPATRTSLQALINSIERRYPDKTVYGTIADMEARDDGLALRPVLTEAGAALVNEGGLTCFSPHWLCVPGQPIDGQATQVPVFLVSIGLTDRPNIAGTSLVNELGAESSELTAPSSQLPASTLSPMNKTLVLELLATLGCPLANEASDEQLATALGTAKASAAELAARPEITALVNEQSRATQLTADLATAATQVETAVTALANERAAHAATTQARNETLVASAIQAGRIYEATKPVWLGRLARDFSTESMALANENAAVKTTPKTAELGGRKAPSAARDQFTALVNERLAKGEAYDAAWQATKATTTGKALYEQMGCQQT